MTCIHLSYLYLCYSVFVLVIRQWFLHYVDIVEILFILVFMSNYSWCWNCWFSNFMRSISPVKFLFLEVTESLFWKTIRNTNIDSCWGKNSINFTKHLISIGSWSISTKHRVKSSLINNSIEGSVLILQATNIHLFER